MLPCFVRHQTAEPASTTRPSELITRTTPQCVARQMEIDGRAVSENGLELVLIQRIFAVEQPNRQYQMMHC